MSADFTTATYRPAPATDVRRSRAPRIWAGALLLAGGLCLIFLAGCFLIGVMMIVAPGGMGQPVNAPLPAEAFVLMYVLYGLVAVCLLAAGLLGIIGVRGLWRVLTEEPQEE